MRRNFDLSGPMVALAVGICIVIAMLFLQPSLPKGYDVNAVNLIYVIGFFSAGAGIFTSLTKNSRLSFRW